MNKGFVVVILVLSFFGRSLLSAKKGDHAVIYTEAARVQNEISSQSEQVIAGAPDFFSAEPTSSEGHEQSEERNFENMKNSSLLELGLGDDPFGMRARHIGGGVTNVEEQTALLQSLQQGLQAAPTGDGLNPFNQLRKPIDFPVTSQYGPRVDPIEKKYIRHHGGVDIGGPAGMRVESPVDGLVRFAGYRQGYGYTVEISPERSLVFLLAHLQRLLVDENQQVKKGQVVGFLGNTGKSTGLHLHYEIRLDGQPVNPEMFAFLALLMSPQGGALLQQGDMQ